MACVAALNLGVAALASCDASDATSTKSPILETQRNAKREPAPPNPELWLTPIADPLLEKGRQVWTGTCIDCHSTGLGGAPLIGNLELWKPRIDQGLPVLFEHAKNGFYGDFGEMPARGGNESLSDEEIEAAVRFMATQSGLRGAGSGV